ncbi:MAG: formamidopyrimidine-DNA glycosylase, partial [Kiritimatiellia bacterium]
AIDSLGNAYADEVLFAAGLHPKTRCNKVDEQQAVRLHGALVQVLTAAIAEIERRQPDLDVKVRDFLKVRNRKGEPCSTCGGRIRTAGVRGHDAFFCPTCQPDSTGRAFVDWRKLNER